jgi:catechol 2,3-dioxygenase-like lactoylglutathione lyase family enzyme
MIKIRHIAILVKNLDRSLAFYQDTLGLQYVRTRAVSIGKAVDLTDGENNLTLLVSDSENEHVQRNKNNFGLDHIGFLVDDIDFIHDRLKTAGAEFISQAPAEFFKVLDPDGVVIDIASTSRGW